MKGNPISAKKAFNDVHRILNLKTLSKTMDLKSKIDKTWERKHQNLKYI